MKRHLIVSELMRTPWAMHPAALSAMASVISRWSCGLEASESVAQKVAADIEARTAKRNASVAASGGGIAVIPVYGVITQRGNMADDISGPGSCSTQIITRQIREAINDERIGAILLDIDSPGGSVYGVSELGAEIFSARNTKPIIGISNSLCASAAYWIGSQCSELYCTPSGEVGSVGVYTAHADYSKAYEASGVKMTLVSAAKYKTEGNPFEPLSEEAKAAIQKSVDDYYSMFTQAIAKGRGVAISSVRDDMGQGRCLSAKDALFAKMIDGIATFDEVVGKIQKDMRSARSPKAESNFNHYAADLMRSRLALS